MATAKKSSAKASHARSRELIDTGKDKRYVRRNDQGQFEHVVEVGRSLAKDRQTKAKRTAKKGQGDKGDRKS